MASPLGRPLEMLSSLISFALPPSTSSDGFPVKLGPTALPSMCSLFYPSSPAAYPSPPPLDIEGSEPQEPPLLWCASPIDTTQGPSSSWATLASTATALRDTCGPHSAAPLPCLPSFLSPLPESPLLLTAPSQQFFVSSSAAGPSAEEHAVALTRAWPHAALADPPLTAWNADVVGAEQSKAVTSANAAEESHTGAFPDSAERSELVTSPHTAEQRHKTSFPTSLGEAELSEPVASPNLPEVSLWRSCSAPPLLVCCPGLLCCAAGAGEVSQLNTTCCPGAPHNYLLECEASQCLARRIHCEFRTCYSPRDRTSLSRPAAGPPPLLNEAPVALRPGVQQFDAPLPARFDSPASLHFSARHSQREKCNDATTSTLHPETSVSTAQVLSRHDSDSNRHLAVTPSPTCSLPDSAASPNCDPCVPQLRRGSQQEALPLDAAAVRSEISAFERELAAFEEAVALIEQKFAEDRAQGLPQPVGRTKGVSRSGIAVNGRQDVRAGLSGGRPCPPICPACNQDKNGRKHIQRSPAKTVLPSLHEKEPNCSLSPVHTRCQQTMPEIGVNRGGGSRRKRKRPEVPQCSQENTVVAVTGGLQQLVQHPAPAASMSAASDITCSDPYGASSVGLTPAAASTAASPVASVAFPSPTTADSMSPASGRTGPTLTAGFIQGSTAVLPVPEGTSASAADEFGAALPAVVGINRMPMAVNGVHADPAGFKSSPPLSAAADSPPASPPLLRYESELSLPADPAGDRIVPSSHTAPCHNSTVGAVVSALKAAAGITLSPGAVSYALAVKLFGFTPTPGFLPDPNPFDELDRYLAKRKKEGATEAGARFPPLKQETTRCYADPNGRMPSPVATSLHTPCSTHPQTSSAAAAKQYGGGYVDLPVTQLRPPAETISIKQETSVASVSHTSSEHVNLKFPSFEAGPAMAPAGATMLNAAAPALAYSAEAVSSVRPPNSSPGATYEGPAAKQLQCFPACSDMVAPVQSPSQPIPTVPLKLPERDLLTERHEAENALDRVARGMMAETGYITDGRCVVKQDVGAVGKGHLHGACQMPVRKSHPSAVKTYADCSSMESNWTSALGHDSQGETFLSQEGCWATAGDKFLGCKGGGGVPDGGGKPLAAGTTVSNGGGTILDAGVAALDNGWTVGALQVPSNRETCLDGLNFVVKKERQEGHGTQCYGTNSTLVNGECWNSYQYTAQSGGPVSLNASAGDSYPAAESLPYEGSGTYLPQNLQTDIYLSSAVPFYRGGQFNRGTAEQADRAGANDETAVEARG